MEKDDEVPDDNIRNSAKWRVSEETLQRATEAGHRSPRIEVPHKIYNTRQTSSTGKVLSRQIDSNVWTEARLIAQEVARASLGYSEIDDSKPTLDAINTRANRLIVIGEDGSVTIYNTPKLAEAAKKRLRDKKTPTE